LGEHCAIFYLCSAHREKRNAFSWFLVKRTRNFEVVWAWHIPLSHTKDKESSDVCERGSRYDFQEGGSDNGTASLHKPKWNHGEREQEED
jgi:hypothetical protein